MTMNSIKMKRLLDDRLKHKDFRTSYHRDQDTYRIEWTDSGEGVNIKLPNVIAKYNQQGDQAIDVLVDHIQEALRIMKETPELQGKEKHIFPVIRSTSFPVETKAGIKLLTKEHTAETRVFYALDFGKSYRLIDEDMIQKEQWTKSRVHEMAMFNIRSLSNTYKHDRVAGNDFYFVAHQDGYDASRILNEALLAEMKANAQGELAVAVPHQDVLIFADIQNKTGYDILQQMTMKFFAEGRIPITALSFIYEHHTLEPIFILAKNRRTDR